MQIIVIKIIKWPPWPNLAVEQGKGEMFSAAQKSDLGLRRQELRPQEWASGPLGWEGPMLNHDFRAPPPLQGSTGQDREQLLGEWWKDQMCLIHLRSPKTRCACFLMSVNELLGGLAHSKGHSSVGTKVQPGMMTWLLTSYVTLGKYLLLLGPDFIIIKMKRLKRVDSKAMDLLHIMIMWPLTEKVFDLDFPAPPKKVINLIIW